MRSLLQDLRFGARLLLKKPGFTLAAALTLALGIGASTAIFSVVNAVLLRPLPYRDADRIMTLWQVETGDRATRKEVPPANFLDWREQNRSFEQMALIEPFGHSLTGSGEPEAFRSWLVTSGFFEILGVNALHGRTFLPEEYEAGGPQAVVIGFGLWQRRFGGDPNLVGQVLNLNRQPHTVVGIMPPEFQFPPGRELWMPRVRLKEDMGRSAGYTKVVARLRPGVTLEQAQADMDGVALQLAKEYPQTNSESGVSVVPLREQMVGHVRPALLVLLAAVGFVLLIACANVTSILLARGAERQKEFAIRSALGARRSRLMLQLLTEGVLLAALGGGAGVLLAVWASDLIFAFSPADLPRVDQINIDGPVLGFSLAISIVTALVSSLAPALQLSRPDLSGSLKEGGRSSTLALRHRLRNGLVISEIALALVLLVGAGLLIRSFVSLMQVDPGFTADRALALEVHVWRPNRTAQQRATFFEQTIARLSALPGVEAAAAVSALPFHDNRIGIDTHFTVEGRPAPPGQEQMASVTFATVDYFKAMGIPLVRGRLFTRFDNQDAAQVLLVNETMARRFWPDEDPVGKRLTFGAAGPGVTREIVGVVGDTRQAGLDSNPKPEIFVPHLQNPYGSMTYVVRTSVDPNTLLEAVKAEIRAFNKDLPFSSISTMETLVSKSLGERRFNLLLLGSFALLALLLAAVGIYGLISYSITQRTHEIGVRMALGAEPRDILKMILRQGLALILSGMAIGLAGAALLTRFIGSLLYGVSATDPLTFVVIPLILTGVALAACFVPARRAIKVDPLVALRYE